MTTNREYCELLYNIELHINMIYLNFISNHHNILNIIFCKSSLFYTFRDNNFFSSSVSKTFILISKWSLKLLGPSDNSVTGLRYTKEITHTRKERVLFSFFIYIINFLLRHLIFFFIFPKTKTEMSKMTYVILKLHLSQFITHLDF